MKIILIAIVLLSSLQYAYADITLTISGQLKNSDNRSITYSIKNQQLKFVESGQSQINIYNAATEEFISLHPQSGKRSTLNKQRLQQRVNQLNTERLKTLTDVEKKLRKDLSSKTTAQQEAAETLLNSFKYPEFYGEHTSLTVKPVNRSKVVNGIDCKIYHLYKLLDLVKSFCLADASALKMSATEYQTLRSFYHFNYTMQSQILIAMGDTKFTLIDYDQHAMPGVIIEESQYQKPTNKTPKIGSHRALKEISYRVLNTSDFSLLATP